MDTSLWKGLSLWLSEHQRLLLNLLEATSKVVESVGVFFPSPFESREVSLSVTLTDAICSLFGNTLFKSNLRRGGLREPLWLVFRTVIWWTSPSSFEGNDRRKWDFKSGKLASGPAQTRLPASSLRPAENKSSRVGKWHGATSRQLPGHRGLWQKARLPGFRACPKAWGGKTCHSALRRWVCESYMSS